jgi:hypothetical protein
MEHDRLAAKLGRPPATLSAFEGLRPDQVTLLCDAIDGACDRRRRLVESALSQRLPPLARVPLARLLRAGLR